MFKNYRADFPIFKTKINSNSLIYLDSAATTQKPQVVIDSLVQYYKNYNANVRRGLYPISEKATEKVEEVRNKVAHFINAKNSSEIIFVRNTTEAINLVAHSFMSHNIKEDDLILSTIMEHHSNFVPWQQTALMKKAKFEVLDIDENYDLILDVNKLKKAKIFTIAHISNVLGRENPVKKIIKKVRKINANILVFVDSAQSIPHLKIDVQDLDCDFLAFSGHKMLASTGIGVLYGKSSRLKSLTPFLYGGEMIKEVTIFKTTFDDIPYKFEAGTPDIAGIISLGAAIEYINSTNINNIHKHVNNLSQYFLNSLKLIPEVNIINPSEAKRSLVSFTIKDIHAHDIAQILGDMGICVRAGHHCAIPLHKKLKLSATTRASFYLYNTQEDIDKLIIGIKKVIKVFKNG